ncbi:UNVERIFIED_CONTAM: hypothetical protein Sradi_7182200 [Sesamum radiatum]|uniref:DUF4283 domain-containing protein n=1 Tax=Sesamum radiatum TaxID=300843 RepID=A0AAW2ISI5_SESRA
MHSVDKIVVAFHNSTRKTLSFIPPSTQNGEIVVRPSLDVIRNGAKRWATTAVGYFLGKRPYFHHVNEYVCSVWPMVREVKATSNGFFFFEFNTMAAMEEVTEGGPWLFRGQALILQKWEPRMMLRKLQHTQVPVWIKLRHLPIELWTTEGLSTVASGIGKPLYPDAITRACTRLDFDRVCVMLDISSKLLKHIVIMVPKEEGGESACKVDVEYEWLPPKCNAYMSLGHPTNDCHMTKSKHRPPVSVYVQKPPAPLPQEQRQEPRAQTVASGSGRGDHEEPGTTMVLYNPFDALMEPDEETETPKGPGNRIWLAWDNDLLGVDVLDMGNQFVHCDVFIHYLHVHVFITIVYGVNDVVGRRLLSGDIERISHTVGDVPWLVGGDFNTVLDDSEVCCQSGDISGASEEFQGCLRDTGLITLPMQGEWCSWHNCSSDSRMFRFDNYLTLSSEFIPSVQRVWQHHIVGTAMFAITRKLKALKPIFRAQRQKRVDPTTGDEIGAKHAPSTGKIAWMKGGDQYSRIFFRKDLLGGARRHCVLDICYLRPWARHVLSEAKALTLVQPVTPNEIKLAVFDIDEVKAPGPDGYSSGFSKAAWPVVGEEVTRAVMEFFRTGNLLKEVNATLISFIPKVGNPTSVTEFRPISCCNVLYKIITKILVQRMPSVLDLLISPSQNAFVPGRSIGDNILLAQELF